MRGLDETRHTSIVAQRHAQFTDRLVQRIGGHGRVRPERVEQLVSGHEHAGTLGEVKQHRPGLRPQRHHRGAAQEATAAQVDAKGGERDRCRFRQRRTFHLWQLRHHTVFRSSCPPLTYRRPTAFRCIASTSRRRVSTSFFAYPIQTVPTEPAGGFAHQLPPPLPLVPTARRFRLFPRGAGVSPAIRPGGCGKSPARRRRHGQS